MEILIMNKRNFIILILSSCLLTSSCSLMDYDLSEALYRHWNVNKRAKSLKILDSEKTINEITSDDEYDVLIFTDVHFGNENNGRNGKRREKEWFEKLTEINSSTNQTIIENVRFAICLGDIADHGLVKETLRFKEEIEKELEKFNIKTYNIVGNHDLYNSGWNQWSENLNPGTSFYKFSTQSFSWYFIDSASGTIGSYQFDSLLSDMKNDDKIKFVFSHIPIYAENFTYFVMQDSEERNKLISCCAKYNIQAFIAGHTHYKFQTDLGKFVEYTIPSFLEKYAYAILHVNEKEKTFSIKIMYY